jgi:hypothetical protein
MEMLFKIWVGAVLNGFAPSGVSLVGKVPLLRRREAA